MINNYIDISIITLTKDDNNNFKRTLKSILKQKTSCSIEWLIIDGSSSKNQFKIDKILLKNNLTKFKKKINIKYFNSNSKNINGIFPSMNYGKKISKGKYLIFLNSGDEFYDQKSLEKLFLKTRKTRRNFTLIFGQAYIVGLNNICWFYPGSKVSNIKNWLKYFDPNHQAMLISKKLADNHKFNLKYDLVSDGYWKRDVIHNAEEIIYVSYPICKFHLDGISSSKPSTELFKRILKNKTIKLSRKFIFFIKLIFPKKLFYLYHYLQKIKSYIVDIIF